MIFIIVLCIFQMAMGNQWFSMSSDLYTYMGLHPPTMANSLEPLQNFTTSYCFSLKHSKYCGGQGGYGNYSMASLVTVRGDFVYDYSTLDSTLDNYFNISDDSGNGNVKTFGCRSWDPDLKPRFRITYTCHALLNSAEAQLCNQNRLLTYMCPAACTDYINDLASYTVNRTFCPNITFSENTRQSLAHECHSQLPTIDKDECIYDVATENEICGFQMFDVHDNKHRHVSNESVSHLCTYCQILGKNKNCCQVPFVLEHCRESNPKSRYIYMPMIAAVASLCALAVTAVTYYIYWRKNRQQRRKSKLGIGRSEGILTTTINNTARSALYQVWRQKNVDVNMPLRQTSLAFPRKETGKIDPPACNKKRAETPDSQPPCSSCPSIDKRDQSLRGYPKADLEIQYLTESDILNVVYSFTAREGDELTISINDRVRLLRSFSDGWAFVQRVGDGMIGAVPAVCLHS